LLVALTCLTLTAAATACPCPADVDGSGTVDVDDLLIVLTEWGPCNGCAGDVNDDDVVDFVDLLDVLTAWGPCNFDYEPLQDDAEAEQIGLEMLGAEGPLRMPDDTYDRIDRDLELIRIAEPTLASENCTICGYDDAIHSPAWTATKLLVRKVPKAPPDDYEAFNACFDVVREDHLFGDVYVLHFPHALNAPALAILYTGLDSVEHAQPAATGGRSNFWVPTSLGGGVWRWDIDDGFCDCPAGCYCHRFFVFEVDGDGVVELISFEYFPADCSGPCQP
jgi:hypothetical protein